MVHHNCVVHVVHIFLPIKLVMMGQIFARLINFDEGPIYRFNATLKLWKLCH